MLCYNAPENKSTSFSTIHEDKREGLLNIDVEDFDDVSMQSGVSSSSVHSTISSKSV